VRCLVFTDGRLQHSDNVQPMGCATLLVDMELAPVRLGRAQHLAEQLQADYQHLEHFKVVD
jgi:magnesium chelatase subunit ChlD-like protein